MVFEKVCDGISGFIRLLLIKHRMINEALKSKGR